MPSTRELRRRIRSVKNTAQITKAMQMVAATKMRRAQNQALAGRAYNHALTNSLARLLERIDPTKLNQPLLLPNKAQKSAALLLSTDKSLCGALNTNLFRFVQTLSREHPHLAFYTIGKKGRSFIVKTEKDLVADFENDDSISFVDSAKLARFFISSYLKEEIKELFLIFPHFISTLRQEPQLLQILPVDKDHIKVDEEVEKDEQILPTYLLEPDPMELFEYMLTHFVETQVYQAMLETKASEHSARMMAMQNATDNAQELVTDLQLAYNQTRQASITNELLEITSAIAALE